jgi:hypothetical protein
MWWWGGGGRREIYGGKCQENISTVNCEKRVLFGIEFLLRILLELLLVELCTTSVGLKRSSKRILKRNSKEDTFSAIGCNIF